MDPQTETSPDAAISSPAPASPRPRRAQPQTIAATKGTKKPTRPGARPRIRRVPGLDGIRGIAVAAVVLYHFFGDLLPGGYLGVDVFFVLSGFLITSLLVREKAVTGRVSLSQFWLRRARRIFPAATFVLIIMTAIGGWCGGDAAVGLPRQFFSSLLFTNNWAQIIASRSYFADQGAEYFAHYWSLSVEEQFYVLWPLLFLLIMKVAGKKRARRAILAFPLLLALLSALAMLLLYDPQQDPSRVYYGTDTHAFGLLLGVALALGLSSHSSDPEADSWPVVTGRRTWGIPALVAMLVLLALFFTLPDQSPVTYRGGLLVASIATVVVVAGIVRGHTIPQWVGERRVLRHLGAISFSLYLWHWPVVIVLRELVRRLGPADIDPNVVMWISGLLGLVISMLLSEWSFKHIETPFRRYGYQAVFRQFFGEPAGPSQRWGWAGGAVALTVLTLVSLIVAPQHTRLEADLAAAAQDKGTAEQAVNPAEEKEKEERVMPSGDKITAIGDSVLLASKDAMMTEFPGIYVDGEVSRHYAAAPGIISGMESQGTLDPFVVLSFGTNGPSSGAGDPELLNQIIDSLGEDRTIILVMPYGDRGYMAEAQEEVRTAAQEHENVYVADWCHVAQANHGLLREDQIHPEPQGATAYAHAVRSALEQWQKDEKKVPAQCGV
ncbi:acetyltransferase [Corynebacterium uropygiale]|uniref:Acetyltransferase n=1 Tax=Corynebacterium uropygiale TaxID=1775911 RepID=A0A9X1QN32_9CORY|nr:acetyltransferase [Corynebacterium uropygiale]